MNVLPKMRPCMRSAWLIGLRLSNPGLVHRQLSRGFLRMLLLMASMIILSGIVPPCLVVESNGPGRGAPRTRPRVPVTRRRPLREREANDHLRPRRAVRQINVSRSQFVLDDIDTRTHIGRSCMSYDQEAVPGEALNRCRRLSPIDVWIVQS